MLFKNIFARLIILLFAFELAACSPPADQANGPGSLSLAASTYAVAQGAGTVVITVNRSNGSSGSVSVNYSTSNGSAIAGADYTAASGMLTWAAGDSAPKTISIPISNNVTFAGTRDFTVSLSSPSVASLAAPSSTVITINGSGDPGTIEPTADAITASQASGTVSISVNRTGGAGAASIDYATVDETAVAGTDYTAKSGTLNWDNGDTSTKSVDIPISSANAFLGVKTFSVTLSSVLGASQGKSKASKVTIVGNAQPGAIALASAAQSVTQGAGVVALLTVNRSGGSAGTATVNYATANGSATTGSDYTAASGTLTWAAGDATPKSISIPISNAVPFTGSKTFAVTLSAAAGATLGAPATATVTITGSGTNSTPGTLSLASGAQTVPQTVGTISISVNRSGGSSGAASVSYSTGNGTALAGTNYTAVSGTLNWPSGDSSAKVISIPISSAPSFSGSKAFTISLAGVSGASLGTPSSSTVTISGSGAPGTLALSSTTNSVGQAAGTVSVTVNRTGGSSGTASVAYASANGTAVAGTNYTNASGTLNWASGDAASKTFTIPISNATPFTGTKDFTVNISNATGATLGSATTQTVTINGSGAAGNLAFATASYSAAQSGGSVTVTVNRNVGSTGAASVAYATTDGTATAGSQYTATSGTLNWASGDMAAKTISIPLSNTTLFSGTKTFSIALSGATGATLGTPASATVTITGSAVPGTLALSTATYAVNQSTGTVTVTVNRTGGSGGAATVAYATSNSTAIAGTDYTAAGGTLNWADGDAAAKTVAIPISTNPLFSGTKTFSVSLSNATGASLGTISAAAITITGSGAAGSTSADLNWTAPMLNSDGSTITDLVGYVIYYGTNSSNLDHSLVISSGSTTTAQITGLTAGATYYFAISSVTTSGGESARSNLANKYL